MIAITNHCMEHWLGRCGQERPPDRPTIKGTKMAIQAAVESGRMATRDEARAVSLYLQRSRWRNSDVAHSISAERIIVCDDIGVVFLFIVNDDIAVVQTAIVLDKVWRYANGLPTRRLRTRNTRRDEMLTEMP